MKKRETKTHVLYLDEHGIIHIDLREGAHVELSSLHEVHKICNELAGNGKKLVMVDARPHHTMTDEAMSYLNSQMVDKSRLATGIISEKLAIRIMVDYITNILKPHSPVQMFSTEEEALKWLLEFKK